MYFVMRPRAENGGFAVTSAYREVLFRFGSWCYGGSVQLTPLINLSDIPHVIPALRMQQSRLEFVYSADQVPATSPYTKPMAYMMKHAPLMEREIFTAEDVLSKLVERLTDTIGGKHNIFETDRGLFEALRCALAQRGATSTTIPREIR